MRKTTSAWMAAFCYLLGTAAVCAQTISAAPVPSSTAPANNFANSIGATGLGYAQPSFPNLSGQATLGQLPNINANSVLGNNTGSPAIPIQLTSAQITAMINQATASLSGALPAWPNSTTTFFRGDGTYQPLNLAAISGIGTMASQDASAVAITGGTAAFTGVVSNTFNQSAGTSFQVVNSNSGTGSAAAFVAASDVAGGAFGAASSGYSSLAVLTGRAYVYGTSAAAGVAIDASGSGNPIVLATNDIERGRVLLGLQVGTTTRDAAGVVNAGTGFNIAGTAASGNVLRGNGTNFVSAQLGFSDMGGQATLTQFPNINANSVLGNNTGSSAVPVQLTSAQITAMINQATTSLSGALPAWPNNTTTFFRGDGTYAALNFGALGGQATMVQLPPGTSDQVLGYWGSTTASAIAVSNCSNALIYSTSTHSFGCNSTAGTGTVTSAGLTAGTGISLGGAGPNPITSTGNITITNAGVTSIAGNAGAFTLTGGITNSGNAIQLALNNAVLQSSPGNPTGTSSGTGVMMGLGSSCHITPVYSGRVRAEIITQVNAPGSGGVTLTGKYGTGTAPSNGAAFSGTSFTPTMTIGVPAGYTGSYPTPAAAVITGLSNGTAYWFDFDMTASGGTGTITNTSCNLMEF